MLLIKISEEGVTILKHKSDMFPWQQKFDDDDSDSDMNDNNEDLENTQRFVNVLLFTSAGCHHLHLLAFHVSYFTPRNHRSKWKRTWQKCYMNGAQRICDFLFIWQFNMATWQIMLSDWLKFQMFSSLKSYAM